MTPCLVARGVRVAGRLRETDISLAGGTLTALVGANGSGKTSLLRRLAEIDAGAGEVRVDGRDVLRISSAERRRLLSFLPASRELAWPLRARDVIALGSTTPDLVRVANLLALFDLKDLADRPVDRLSTGERARVLLARALAPTPRVLLLDEPLSNLDPAWVLRTLTVLRDVAIAGAAVLVSLHDLTLVGACDRVVLMGDGAIQEDGEPRIVMAGEAIARWFGVRRSTEDSGWTLA